MDAILVRVPDGMKVRIARRAMANGRSMSAEVVAILSKELQEPDEIAYRALREERDKVTAALEAASAQVTNLRMRRIALSKEIQARRADGGFPAEDAEDAIYDVPVEPPEQAG